MAIMSDFLDYHGDVKTSMKVLRKQIENPFTQINDNNLKELVLGTQKVEQINGSVTIPIATTELSGIVKSSENTNSVSVQGDGTMEVNKININKIVQDSGDTLILKSGDSFI
jgi:hypothetical protein